MIYLLNHLVEREAQHRGDAEAFRVPGRSLSYGELERRANRLAHGLIAEGVRRGDRVGIFMSRELESAVAVFGILKAGAAFVPIDPHVPAGGLRQLIEDCGIQILISHRQQVKTLARLAEDPSPLRCVFGVEADAELGSAFETRSWSDLETLPETAPDLHGTEDDLAYLMYSSGSTGRPKGIMHTHRSGLAYARLSAETYQVTSADRIGNHSPLHFDMSTFGYFTSPLAGASTVLVPEAYTKLTASLSQLIEAEKLTIWYSVPLALIQLLTRGVLESRDLSSLRWILFGGEPFARQHLHALMRQWPQARFSNVYGPAETNQCTFYHVPTPSAEDDEAEPVPIGRVWANTEGLVLGEDDQPVKTGEIGELVIRSPTRMRGYWARPDLDAKSFYRQSADGGFERVFYRTGDLVLERADGELLFLGRKDRQVKVRGYRLELDEIERTLMSHEKVEEAAVVPLRGSAGGSGAGEVEGLYAAVSLKPGEAHEAESLRSFLRDILSWYAVPKTIDLVTTFPRTTSGKIDRRAVEAMASQAD